MGKLYITQEEYSNRLKEAKKHAKEQGKKNNLLTAKRCERSLTKNVRKKTLEEVLKDLNECWDKSFQKSNTYADTCERGLRYFKFRLNQKIKFSDKSLSVGKTQKRDLG